MAALASSGGTLYDASMLLAHILVPVVLAVAALFVAIAVLPHVMPGPRPAGKPEEGLVIFVEGIRFLGIPWDLRPAGAGLRKAGFNGRYVYWRWHADWHGWLVLPALANRRLHQREAAALAEFIVAERAGHPDRPIWLIGCSAGCHVALRALDMLPPDTQITSAALLAGAFDPYRDLTEPCNRLDGPLLVAVSPMDWFIIGLGTLLFGTADGKRTLSAGMVGLRGRANAENLQRGKIVQIRWRPQMLGIGHLGGHFSTAAPEFIARHIAPALGIGPRGRGES